MGNNYKKYRISRFTGFGNPNCRGIRVHDTILPQGFQEVDLYKIHKIFLVILPIEIDFKDLVLSQYVQICFQTIGIHK